MTDGKNILQKMRPMDFMILGIFIFLIVLYGLFYIGKKTYAPTPVENEGRVAYEIYFKNVIISDGGDKEMKSPFNIDDETFVTIRNVPHSKLKITNGIQNNFSQKSSLFLQGCHRMALLCCNFVANLKMTAL